MKFYFCSAVAIAGVLSVMSACNTGGTRDLTSPDGNVKIEFHLTKEGEPTYQAWYKGQPIVAASGLGFEAEGLPSLTEGFKVTGISKKSVDETWEPVWGESDSIRNNYNSMTIKMQKDADSVKIKMGIEFRAYDDGVAFRYVFPEQKTKRIVITDEKSEFAMTGDHTAWWIPGDYDTQEYEYVKSALSEIRSKNTDDKLGNVSQTGFSPTGVQTSLMLKTADSIYLNIHEAALIDFPAMHLDLNDSSMVFTSWLTPSPDGTKAVIETPFKTPWRVVMVSDKATDILATQIIYNLNEPCAIDDTSWIKPVKFMGVWWEMITGKSEWSYTNAENFDLSTFDYSKATPHGKHGVNNENVKRYIDFAAENGMDQLLVEGWNVGWEDWFGKEKDYVFDFVTPYPDFDIAMLNDYAKSKGIKLMMHHETSGSIPNYERHLDRAYDLMNQYGYNAVKSGYVGPILPKGRYHYGQAEVNHYLDAIKKAAEKKIMVDAHEAVRPTGLARTYPNLLANESAMGTEYQSMSPGHVTILPFTRLKGGPMDFTPGIFKMDLSTFNPNNHNKKRATIANQLALYVTMYSPLQMAADFPEHYAEKADAFQFIKDVPVDWSESRYLDAEPGEFIVVARREKNGDSWYVGGVTNEQAREVTLPMSFLTPGVSYEATFYLDAADTDCDTNPETYEIKTETVTSESVPVIRMARGGGFAISIVPKK